MRPLSRPLAVALLALAGPTLAGPTTAQAAVAGGSGQPFEVHHQPPGLIVRGEAVTILVQTDTTDFETPPSAFVYVRDEPGAPFTKLRLLDGGSRRRVPDQFLDGIFLEDYVVVQDSGTDRTRRVPATGAFRSWIRDAYPVIDLGLHRFGHVRPPDSIVARASIGDGPHQVAWFCPPEGLCEYPWSFDVGPRGEVWMLDPHHSRVVGWFPGHPAAPKRSIPISFGPADIAVGPQGTVYVMGVRGGDPIHRLRLYAFAPNGDLKWWHYLLPSIFNDHIRFGPDGILDCADSQFGWVPVTGHDGRPLTIDQQRRRALPDQPLANGMGLLYRNQSLHENRVALSNGDGTLRRGWRITSESPMGDFVGNGTPGAVDGDPVVVATVYRFQQHLSEHVVLRLSRNDGVLRRFNLARGTEAGAEVTTLRVGYDGAMYQLQGSPEEGEVRVARYSLD